MKILEYKTCLSSDVMRLDFQVNDLIRKGWQPYGSPYGAPDQDDPKNAVIGFMCQAVVRFETDKRASISIAEQGFKNMREAAK